MCPRVEAVVDTIRAQRRSCELQLSLFASALLSYRRETCLKPFPPSYLRDGVKQYELLMDVLKKIPPMSILLERLEDPTYVDTNMDVVDLLHYILVDLNEPTVSFVPSDKIDSILEKAPSGIEVSKPQYVFEIVSSPRSQAECKWKNLAKDKNTFFAYHGSRLENFHSIFRHGLQQHMNKNKLFGSGTYLSSELSVSLPYSPIGLNWECSSLGRYLSCVAMCELVDTPDGLVSQRSDQNGQSSAQTRSQPRASDSMAGEIPHKYYIVSNDDLIRVRYLLVYAKDLPSVKNQLSSNAVRKSVFRQWLSQYKMLILMFAYIFLLTVIGCSNNNSLYYYYKNLYKKINNIFI